MKCVFQLCCFALCLGASTTIAQTLDEQYDFYLRSDGGVRCANMRFEVDAEMVLLPGQAGPQLTQFCSRPPPVSGSGGSAPQGGATATSGGGRTEDTALRRRRERLNNEAVLNADADGETMTLMEHGNAAVFFSLDYQYEKQRATRYSAAHRAHFASGMLGLDYRFGDKGLAGIALEYEDASGDYAAQGGKFDTRGVGGMIFGSWHPRSDVFVDLNVGFVDRALDTQRIVGIRREVVSSPGAPPRISFDPPLTAVESNADGREVNAHVFAGYDKAIGRFTVGPRVGVSIKRVKIEGLIERGATPMALAVDEQREDSLRTSLGFNAAAAFNTSFGALVPQLSIDWLRESEDEQRVLTARFAEDLRPNPSRLRYLTAAPDRDSVRARFSTVAVFTHGVSAFVALEALGGHAYRDRYGATIGIRKEL